jgi:hypothetical protein
MKEICIFVTFESPNLGDGRFFVWTTCFDVDRLTDFGLSDSAYVVVVLDIVLTDSICWS